MNRNKTLDVFYKEKHVGTILVLHGRKHSDTMIRLLLGGRKRKQK